MFEGVCVGERVREEGKEGGRECGCGSEKVWKGGSGCWEKGGVGVCGSERKERREGGRECGCLWVRV